MNDPSHSHTIVLDESPNPHDLKLIWDGLTAYNREHAPADELTPLTIFLRDADNKVVGGLLGNTYWGWLYISILWLDASVRGKGYGRSILRIAEDEAIRRGCHHAHLDTMDFQARPFYERQGYAIYGVLNDLPTGHSRFFMQKELRQPNNTGP